ncbi:Adenylate kinase, chloroplastic [Gracilariopsis chorda]|uniref:Adenylate kinase, chloroplastic n=1 Tax=Gracilariopsis chorda TaxID=448386 RepID=A0A2V3IEJ3_9FLOR|nr:Adenylate kinase, chloroplastic [Gracilariopsis chorda]|eukprot:PXF40484.1 Adenylate kinase, chloroplastic [Gracilariopsis chorda]
MAFVTPGFHLTPWSSSKPRLVRKLRSTNFLPRPNLRAQAWSHALRSAPPTPLVIKSPLLVSMSVAAPPKILISGAPASGKGTQCEFIVQKYDVVHISTGDMLRAAVRNSTPLGLKAKSYMDSGALVPDELVISMLKERITQHDCVKKGWLLDGFPRTAVQAKALDEADVLPSAVVVLEVADDALIERVVGRRTDPETGKIYHMSFSPPTDPEVEARLVQRSDDTEEKARVRLKTYYTHAQSINDHYGSDVSLSVSEESIASNTSGSGEGSSSESSKYMPVAEFVRRAEEAYERGVLLDQDVNWSGQATADTPESAGTSSYADLARRLDLVLGDVLALVSFAYIGRYSHGNKSLDFEVLKTAAPFISAWLISSPLLGAYTRAATANIPATLKYFVRAWAVAVPMGIGLRGVVTDHVPPVVFAVISLVATLLLMGSWRTLYVLIRGDETDSARRGGVVETFKMVTTLLRRW